MCVRMAIEMKGEYCIECVVVVNAECGIETAGQPLYPLMGGDMLTLSYTPSLYTCPVSSCYLNVKSLKGCI